jgi:hypothetical protein
MSDQEFWGLIEALSEPAGAFTLSDNFVSNEPHYAEVVRWLRPSGGAYIGVGPEQYSRNSTLVRERLLTTRGLPLSQVDLDWINRAFNAFYADGPKIDFWGSRAVDSVRPSYRLLMTAQDVTGQSRSFLGTEEGFRCVKELHSRNVIVPVVGDFGGPKAMQRVGNYVREHTDVIHAVYGSNVGVYLTNEGARAYCRNLATLPSAPRAWFIESDGMRSLASKLRACPPEKM